MVRQIDSANPSLFGNYSDNAETSDKGQETEERVEGNGESGESVKRTAPILVYIGLMEAVAEVTRLNFNQLYEMPAIEFLSYVSYVDYKRRKEEQMIREFKAKHK